MASRFVPEIALVAACLAAAPGAARECGPLKQLASAKLTMQGKYQPIIAVTVNGVPKRFLVDTGGIHTQLSSRGAADLKLDIQNNATAIYDASGTASHSYAKIAKFEMGGMAVSDAYLRITPTDLYTDGLIAPDIMTKYDVEMDFAGGRMNYFLPDHCPGKVVYWPHGDVARVSLYMSDKTWIRVPVVLDGKSFTAILDTGATTTTITTKVAEESFGLTTGSAGMEPAGYVNGDPRLASYFHNFSGLSLNGITIKNLRVLVMPDRITEQGPKYRYFMSGGAIYSQKRMEAPDLILGMDVLKHLRLYFAFGEEYLYATVAEVPKVEDAAPSSVIGKLSPVVLIALRDARDAYKKQDYPAALAAIAKARAADGIQPFDLLMINRMSLSVHLGMKDMTAALADAGAAVDAGPDVIPSVDKAGLYKAALQLALLAKQYDRAVQFAKLYQTVNPPATDVGLIKAALAHDGDAGAASK